MKWVRAHNGAGSLPNLTLRLDRLDEVNHFDGARCAVEALVAGLRASTLNCLLDGVGGYHAEEHRHAGLQANLSNALGGLIADQVVVRRCATDYRTQADNRTYLPDSAIF